MDEHAADFKTIERTLNNGVMCAVLKAIPDTVIFFAVALGLYTRWLHYGYLSILTVAVFGLFLLASNTALRYYFSIWWLNPIFHGWLACATCLIAFWDDFRLTSSQKHLDDLNDVIFLCSCVACLSSQVAILACRSKKPIAADPSPILGVNDYFRFAGILIACLATGHNWLSLFTVTFAFFLNLIALRLKSMWSILNLLGLCAAIEGYLLPGLNLSINPYAIICILYRLYTKPILEILTVMQSGTKFELFGKLILARRIWQRCLILSYFCVEMAFFYSHASVIKNHKEWFIIVPVFVVIAIFWFLIRLLFVIMLFSVTNKFYECCQSMVSGPLDVGSISFKDPASVLPQLKKVLAARGLRYFGLMARQFVQMNMMATFFIVMLCWTTRNAYNHQLTSAVLALLLIFYELFNELATNLGGTCIGYSVVVPIAESRADGFVNLLPTSAAQEISLRSTACVQATVRFFGQHVIRNFGCDFSGSGLDFQDLRRKLLEFFDQKSPEGPHFDTYILYFSGPVNEKGDWVMKGNTVVSLETILELWREVPSHQKDPDHDDNEEDSSYFSGPKTSRLILICDCENADQWIRSVRKVSGTTFVALQTYSLASTKSTRSKEPIRDDKESVLSVGGGENVETLHSVGDFTRLFVEYNAAGSHNRTLFDTLSPDLRPRYAVSRNWSDFRLARPDKYEVRVYWRHTLPRWTHGTLGAVVDLMAVLGYTSRVDALLHRLTCVSVLQRWRLKLFPPAELDTGHGFKLLSF